MCNDSLAESWARRGPTSSTSSSRCIDPPTTSIERSLAAATIKELSLSKYRPHHALGFVTIVTRQLDSLRSNIGSMRGRERPATIWLKVKLARQQGKHNNTISFYNILAAGAAALRSLQALSNTTNVQKNLTANNDNLFHLGFPSWRTCGKSIRRAVRITGEPLSSTYLTSEPWFKGAVSSRRWMSLKTSRRSIPLVFSRYLLIVMCLDMLAESLTSHDQQKA